MADTTTAALFGRLSHMEIIRAHSKRLGLGESFLVEALLSYGASELLSWVQRREAEDPGSVWYSGDLPDWLEPHT
jgi:hypothetical protein